MADEEDHKERIDREFSELLEELRVALPGAEVLFAFLLGIAFTNRFETTNTLERSVYFATLLCTAGATALLIAPSAYHRLHFRDNAREKERMLFTATNMAIAGLVLLLAAVAGAVYVVGSVVYSSQIAAVAAAGVAALFLWFWFGSPLSASRLVEARRYRPVGSDRLTFTSRRSFSAAPSWSTAMQPSLIELVTELHGWASRTRRRTGERGGSVSSRRITGSIGRRRKWWREKRKRSETDGPSVREPKFLCAIEVGQ